MNRSQDSLIGKTILVVGVTGFIGAAVACRHAAGASVIGVSRSPPKSQTCKRGGELFHLGAGCGCAGDCRNSHLENGAALRPIR